MLSNLFLISNNFIRNRNHHHQPDILHLGDLSIHFFYPLSRSKERRKKRKIKHPDLFFYRFLVVFISINIRISRSIHLTAYFSLLISNQIVRYIYFPVPVVFFLHVYMCVCLVRLHTILFSTKTRSICFHVEDFFFRAISRRTIENE